MINYGVYWSAVPNDMNGAWHLSFNSNYVYPVGDNYRGYGFVVRPCQE